MVENWTPVEKGYLYYNIQYICNFTMYVWYIVGLGGSRFCGWIKQGSLVWPFTHIIKGMKQKSSWGSALKIPQYGTGFKSFVYYTELVVFLISSLSASRTTSLLESRSIDLISIFLGLSEKHYVYVHSTPMGCNRYICMYICMYMYCTPLVYITVCMYIHTV